MLTKICEIIEAARGIRLIFSVSTALRASGRSLCPRSTVNRDGVLRQLSAIFVTGILYSILIVSYHHNDGCVIRSDCPICKFAIDFASGDNAAIQTLPAPHFVVTSFVPESAICVCEISPATLTTRAPPPSSLPIL